MEHIVSAKELKSRMASPEGVFILDVRGTSAYEEWRIQDRGVESVNIQTSKLRANGPAAYPELPKDREIITVCAKGVAAREAAEILSRDGYNVSVLDGGMQEWSAFHHPVTVAEDGGTEIIQVQRLGKGCISYVLVSQGEAIVVDPSRHIAAYEEIVQERGAVVKHVLDTHLHADHISGGTWLAAATGAKYWIGPSEMEGSPREYHALGEGLTFHFGQAKLDVIVIPTPGHTPGSTSFLVNDRYMLSGDTVFVNGLGRPDLGGKAREWAGMLYRTVVDKISRLDDGVLILPAHHSDYREINERGYVGATLGALREENELLRGGSEERFTDAVAQRAGATPPNYETVVQINRGALDVSDDEASELEIGPNRCAVKHA